MSADERQELAEGLVGLAGLQGGSQDAFPDGTRYEYDSRFKTTLKLRLLADGFRWVYCDV